jgi:hypothetical protein
MEGLVESGHSSAGVFAVDWGFSGVFGCGLAGRKGVYKLVRSIFLAGSSFARVCLGLGMVCRFQDYLVGYTCDMGKFAVDSLFGSVCCSGGLVRFQLLIELVDFQECSLEKGYDDQAKS